MSDGIAVMREGRVEQIGTPIYKRPATRFIAGFIGTANLISEPQGAVVIRSERLKLCAPGGESWPATVERVVYLGPRLELRLRLPDDRQLLAEAVNDGRTAWSGGDRATAWFRPEDAWVILEP